MSRSAYARESLSHGKSYKNEVKFEWFMSLGRELESRQVRTRGIREKPFFGIYQQIS